MLFVLAKGSHQFKVTFTIRDTSDGYTINFTTKILETINKKFSTESTLDKLRDGINLTYKLSNAGWLIDIPDYNDTQQKAITRLDSIILMGNFSKKEYGLLQLIRRKLEKPDGLEMLLEPILLFNEIYSSPPFRNQKDYHAASTFNIFYQPQITGTMVTNIVKFKKQSETANLSVDFIANQDSATKKIIPMYQEYFYSMSGKIPKGLPEEVKFAIHTEYDINIFKGYPQHILKKTTTTYVVKNKSEIRMDIIDK